MSQQAGAAHLEAQGDVIDGALAANEALKVGLNELPQLALALLQRGIQRGEALGDLLARGFCVHGAKVHPRVELAAAYLQLGQHRRRALQHTRGTLCEAVREGNLPTSQR